MGRQADWMDLKCFPGGQRCSSLLWPCLFFGAVRIRGERERTRFIYLDSTFPYLALGALASFQVTQGFQLPKAQPGARQEGAGRWHERACVCVCVCVSESERKNKNERLCLES